MLKQNITRYLGIFLMLDGALSIYWSVQDGCMNNSPIGQLIRIVRIGIGFYLYKYNETSS